MSNKTTKDKMTTAEKYIFSSGDIFGGGGQSIIAVLYLVFLTNILGINPAWAGSVVMVSKLWDAVSDPLMGVISDNTRCKMGRRKPYIFAGGFLIFFAIALLWYPINFESDVAKICYVTIVYLFYSTISTVIAVPYSSMSTEITTDFNDRNKLNLLRLVFSLVSTAICTLVPTLLFENLTSGNLSISGFYYALVFGFGTLFAVPLILIGFFTKERVPYKNENTKFSIKTFIKPFKIKAFRKLLALYLSQSITLDITSAVIIYYSLYVIAGLGPTMFLGIFLGIQILLFPVINKYINKVSKTKIYRMGLPVSIIASIGIAFYPTDLPVWGLYIITGITALGFAGAQTMCWIIFPDVVDIGELGLKERITGSFSGVMTFIRKASSAIAIFIIGNVLSLTGFVTPTDSVPIPNQPNSAIYGIKFIIFFAFLILMGFAYFVARKFRLTPEVSKRVKYFNEKQQADEIKYLSQEEKEEYKRLMQEFV